MTNKEQHTLIDQLVAEQLPMFNISPEYQVTVERNYEIVKERIAIETEEEKPVNYFPLAPDYAEAHPNIYALMLVAKSIVTQLRAENDAGRPSTKAHHKLAEIAKLMMDLAWAETHYFYPEPQRVSIMPTEEGVLGLFGDNEVPLDQAGPALANLIAAAILGGKI